MKILILGGTRFIGLSVLKRCMEQGYDITYLSRKRITETENPKVILGERQDVIYQLKGCSFDVAIDFSAYDSSAVRSTLKNVQVSRYILISSAWLTQYIRQDRNFTATDAAYIQAKMRTERYLEHWQDKTMKRTILRFPPTFGPGDHSGRLDYLATRIFSNTPVTVCDTASRHLSLCYVNDVSALIFRAITSAQQEHCYIGEAIPDETISYMQLLQFIADQLNKNLTVKTASKKDIKKDFPSFFSVDPFWQEVAYSAEWPNPFWDFGVKTTPYFSWLKECLDNYHPTNSKLSVKHRAYQWKSEEFIQAEQKWMDTSNE